MSINFTLEYTDDYIYLKYPADYEITPESLRQKWAAVGEACKKYNCYHVLSEALTPPKRNMSTKDAFMAALQAVNVSRDLYMACYFPGYKTDEKTQTFMTVAQNRGINIRFFTNRDQALKWLGINKS
jgi:hypothetical protein